MDWWSFQMSEPKITINGQQLTDGQVVTLRVAIESFATDISEKGLGNDTHGKAMARAYLERISEIRKLILPGCRDSSSAGSST
jgi:hypothetical protein